MAMVSICAPQSNFGKGYCRIPAQCLEMIKWQHLHKLKIIFVYKQNYKYIYSHHHHQCSAQGQVIHCKRKNLGCSSAESSCRVYNIYIYIIMFMHMMFVGTEIIFPRWTGFRFIQVPFWSSFTCSESAWHARSPPRRGAGEVVCSGRRYQGEFYTPRSHCTVPTSSSRIPFIIIQ